MQKKQILYNFIFLLSLLTISAESISQDVYKCPCSKIGLDSSWAAQNNIACYSIPVARDVKNKKSGDFRLAVAMVPSLQNTQEDPLLYLHGGPGIATIENLPRYLESETWKLVRQERGLVFFDYRGTGFSEPELCAYIKDSLNAYSTQSSPQRDFETFKIELYRKCRLQLGKEGIEVATFNSFQLAEDAEAIRQALKINKWKVYGVSFGTTVALNLLRNHGAHISAMILDSPFPPNAPWLDFVRPFDTCFKVLENKIRNDSFLFSRFPSLRKDFVTAIKRLNENPAAIQPPGASEKFPFRGDDFAWSIWSALLKPETIALVPLAIQEVANGNDSILSKWVTAFSNPDAFGKFSELQSRAVLCFEGRPKTKDDAYESLLVAYPDFSSFNIEFDGALCEAWQPSIADNNLFDPVVSDVPVLIFSGEYDPVCPPLFGALTSRTLTKSIHMIVPAASHAAIHADECTRKMAIDFFLDPERVSSTTCIERREKIKFIAGELDKALEVILANQQPFGLR